MEEFERDITLKDGRSARLREVRLGDAAALLECERAVTIAGDGMVRSVDQLQSSPEERERDLAEWVGGSRGGEHGVRLVCTSGERIVGTGHISRMSPSRLQHVAHIGLGVVPEFQGLGVGRAIMEGLLAWTRSARGRGITRVDLGVFSINTRAIRLYESLGFQIEGTRRKFVRFEDGSTCDDHLMALLLD